jgi:hypothetical protein
MNKRAWTFLTGAMASLTVAAGVTIAPADAAGDVTAPTLKTNLNAGFVVGGIIGLPDYSDTSDFGPYVSIPEYINSTTTDNSGGLCGFKVSRLDGDGFQTLIAEPLAWGDYATTPYANHFVTSNDTYSGQVGDSEDSQAGWVLEATDCSGNAIAVPVRNKPVVLEENNYTVGEEREGTIAYSGTWSVVHCACASGGMTKKTTAKGASFTYTDHWYQDDHLGLVMATGSGRGSADIYVDGKKTATVNTYSKTTQNRVIVYDKWMTEGYHTIKVVNLATSGHPRIDLDAVLNN